MSTRLFILFFFVPKIIFSQGSGNTLVFDGNNDYVNVGNQVANNCRTIELWFKPAINITTSLPNPSCLVVRDFDNGNGASTDEFGLAFHPSGWGSNAGRLVFVRRVGSTAYDVVSDQNNWQANHWYHVSVTIDATSGMKMYINGVLQQNTNPSTASIGTQTGSSSDDVSIGRWGNLNQNRYFEGEIDEVRLWDVSRTQQEIRDNMCSSLSGNEPGLRAYWNFDSGSGNTLIDNSLNTYDGTLNNMTNTNWVYSGAPIGDTSTHTYSPNLSTTTTILNTSIGDELTVDNINSNADGVHIYKVDTLPNDTAGIGSPLGNYYGVFLTDINGTFDVSYDYSWHGCTNCDQIHSRNDNADTSWQLLTTTPSNCEFNLSNQSTVGYDYRAEFIIDTSPLLTLNSFLGSDTTICQGDSFDLNASFPGATYLWQDNSTDSVLTVTQGGTYWVEITLNGCTVSDTINVSETIIDPSLGNDTTICTGSSFDLNAFNQGATYLWQDNSTDSVFTVSQGGTYWVEVSKNGCLDSDTINVTVLDPQPSFPSDTSFCQGDSITLNAAFPGATYLWQNGSTDSVFTAQQSGTYWVEVTAGSCVASDTVDVTEINVNLNLGNDTSICFGDTLELNAGNQGATYLWQDNSTDSVFTVTQGGTYWVEVSKNGCLDSDTINVTVLDPQPSFPSDTSFCQGDSITLNAAFPGATYLWQNGSTDSVFTAQQSGTYWVEVIAGSCVASDTVDATEVTLNPDLGNDTTICPDDSIVLNVQHTGANYLWNDNSTDSVLTVNQSGIYWVSVSLGGCSQSDTISVSEYNFNPYLGNDTTICPDSSLLLETQYPTAGHLWQDNSTDSTFLVNQPGTYWVEVTGNNCVSSDTINVDVFDFDSFLGNDTTLCSDSNILLSAPFEDASFIWQDNSTDSTYLADQGGTYWVEVQVNNCLAYDTVEIEEIDFSISLGNDTTICADSSLDLTTGYPGLSHIWQDNSTDTLFSVAQSGTYWVEVDSLGCKESDTIQVQEFNLNPFINNDTTICVDSSLTFTLQYPNSTYLWQDNSTDSVYTVSEPGIYWVEIQGAVCSSTDTIVVDQLSVNPNLGPDTVFCQGSGFYLNTIDSYGSYLWSDNSTASTYFVSEPGTYWVQVEDRGCVGRDTVEVDTINCDTLLSEPEVVLELPNVITPNNDMINDVFTPKKVKGIRSMNTVIYNRWGEKMFESDFTTIMWDAYKVSDGTYFWIIEYTDVNGNSGTKEGDLMILR